VSDERIKLQLKTCQGTSFTIHYADYLAEFFFRANASSVGPNAYDDWVQKGADPNLITTGDIFAVNQTMAARTSHRHWTKFTEADRRVADRVAVGRSLRRFVSCVLRGGSWTGQADARVVHHGHLCESVPQEWVKTLREGGRCSTFAVREPNAAPSENGDAEKEGEEWGADTL
jgi:hypothetical protein